MKKVLLVISVILFITMGFVTILPKKVSATFTLIPSKGNSGGKSCVGKDRCLIVYIAPWCPYCHQSMGAIQTIINEWKNTPNRGISVVIGKDTPDKLEEMAEKLNSQNTFVDTDGATWEELKLKSVPHWIWIDNSNKIVHSISGGIKSGMDAINEFNKY